MKISQEAVNNIAQLRKQNHLTQEQMAEKVGMSKNGYAKLERGESKVHLDHLSQIAEAFNIDITELLKQGSDLAFFIGGSKNKNYCFNQGGNQEIEKLELIIQHQNEIIDLKNNEISLLKQLLTQNKNIELPESKSVNAQ